MVLKRIFKKPTRIGLFGATILALFQSINGSGFSDNVALRTGLQERQICNPVNSGGELTQQCTSGGIPEGKEKLVFPEDLQFEIWGNLEVGTIDYAIVAFLAYTLAALWIHRPIDNSLGAKKKRKMVALKSIRWIRIAVLSLVLAAMSTANKMGRFAEIYNSWGFGTRTEGSLGWHDGSIGFQPFEWGVLDVVELIALFSLFVYAISRGVEVDRAILNPIPDNRNYIEKIWGGISEAERAQRFDVEGGAAKANESFTNLVKLLGASASLNVAAASLDEGNVKVAFNKWKNLTHSKGKQNRDWKALSESLDQAGIFPEEESGEEE